MEKGNLKIGMEPFAKENFKMANFLAKVQPVILDTYMKENGKMESDMEQGKVNGMMRRRSSKQSTLENTNITKSIYKQKAKQWNLFRYISCQSKIGISFTLSFPVSQGSS